MPESLLPLLRDAASCIEEFLIEQSNRELVLPWLDAYFGIYSFLQVAEKFDETYRTIINPDNRSVNLFCVDPSKRLAQTLKGLRATVFFSATLSPIEYFVDVLGGSADSSRGKYQSPFRTDQMTVQIQPVNISFQARNRTMDAVADAVCKHLRENPGNHLIYCPSLAYLNGLNSQLSTRGIHPIAQQSMMNEAERDSFLTKFTQGRNSIGLAVMGGIFAEGIDLPGEQLVGVTVIGVGLPSLSIERDLLSAYFNEKEKVGYDYAYRYPGMQRVLQAVGRLIRSEDDQGAALLIDQRFLEARYEELFPSWWNIRSRAEEGEMWDF